MKTLRRHAALFAAFLLATLAPRAAAACAGCRNPNLPLTRLSNVQMIPGELRTSLALSGTALNVVHQDGCLDLTNCDEIPVQPRYIHNQNIYPGELRGIAEYALTPTWGVEAQLPFRVTKTTIRYQTLEGKPYPPPDPTVHHRNETLYGLGDPWLLGRYGTSLGGFVLTVRGGTTLPLGRTEPDPFALGDVGLRHQHIQFGTGTFDPVLAFDLSRAFGKVSFAAYGLALLTLYENSKGFQAGNRFFAGLSGGVTVREKYQSSLGLDVLNEAPERWQGVERQDGNLGRTELLLNLTLSASFDETTASLVVRVPVFRHIVQGSEDPGRLTSPIMASLILSHTFFSGG
jgi:hypothetical protein